ncbi:hypothetical protein CAPTEDRAFT_178287 [Capitella teleta]|uniref:TM2 domain-containing protein n=1 Tax=Capitella teleta TaxID=283909 RepID=R7UU72_CAPTE|nr:hypothetical protein CAPTEDRAFT_178287 [Capitella teleta]|eukprot:ELU09740.1 hypothetical protein CAPTEDRAFT_178287 [Capitella teleta]
MQFFAILSLSNEIEDNDVVHGYNETCGAVTNPYSPLVNCSYLPEDFIRCVLPPIDHHGNSTAQEELGHGCVKWGAQKYQDVGTSRVWCEVLDGIECCGERRFLSLKEFPCVKYSGHYFVTTLIYSVLLGFLGMDRFCLGHTGTAVGKLLTLGGVGIWWIVDIILLVMGELRPADDSNWMPYY